MGREFGGRILVFPYGAGGEVGIGGGEAGEVVGAEDVGGGFCGGFKVEGEGIVPDVRSEEWGADAVGFAGFADWVDTGEEAVLVGLAESGVAGVEGGIGDRGVGDGEDADGGREGAIEGAVEVLRRDGGG